MTKVYLLGPFRLDTDAETLLKGTEPVPLGRRAVALLRALVERPGMLVPKDALITSAWSGLVVEEANLTVQIAAVRKALGGHPSGERWIETLPRRGYRYVGPLATEEIGAPLRRVAASALPLPDLPSIAVLPFRNVSSDIEQEYFADGMTDEIITGLARINGLFVIARSSAFAFNSRANDIRQAGRELGVRYILQGSVRKAADRVRVIVRLVEAETGTHIWADRYDRPLGDVFALQDEITLSVVGAIEPSLREAEIARVKRKRPENLNAYDLVLRAIPQVYIAVPEQAARAIPLLERSLALEAEYAGAHGLLAWCHLILFVRAGYKEENRAAAIRHARAAVAHGREDATVLAMGAFAIGLIEHDHVVAHEAFERALALSPSSALTLFLGAVALAYAGEAERAIEWARRALRLSPLDRMAFAHHQALAIGHFQRGRYRRAANAARHAVLSNPSFSVSHTLLAAALARLGRTEEAAAAARQVLALEPSFSSRQYCAAIGMAPALAAALTDAWSSAGLPP
jgi:TolB-like protein/Flp pilus assembly protein TadD